MSALMVMSVVQAGAQNLITTECNCTSGSAQPQDGAFVDEFIITGAVPGQTWTVIVTEGLFVVGSDPLQPLPLGTEMVETSAGRYTLSALRLVDTDYQIQISNGSIVRVASNRHTCQSSAVDIIGDFGTCIGTEEIYTIDIPRYRLDNVSWSVTGGTVVAQNDTFAIVQWSTTPGTGSVSVSGDIYPTDSDLNNSVPCDFSASSNVDVMSEQAIVLACNNKLNLTMNAGCEVTITPSLLLEDMMYTDASYDLVLRDIAQDTIIPTSTLTGKYLNTDVEIKVVHECSGNSCWGNLRLEDKSIPVLDCADDITLDCDELSGPSTTGLPIPSATIVTVIDDNTFFVDGFDQCGGVTLDYYDEVTANLCSGPYSSEITRRWLATDASGNTSDCSQRIYINRATFADLTFPPVYDDVLGAVGGQPSLDACGNWVQLPNGYPSPETTGVPMGTFCLNVQVDYEDVLIGGCSDNAFKIKRRWLVSDLCGVEDDMVFNQIIHVADDQAPICTVPPDFAVGTSSLSCGADIDVPAPTVIFECGDWDYFVSYKLRDESGDPFTFAITDGVVRKANGEYRINDVPAGQDSVWIVYTFMDDCGNVSQCFNEVALIDTEEPVPVCDRFTFVALNEDGMGFATPSALDDGSHDNCTLDSMDIRRMDDACGETSEWGQKIKFCCDDIGSTVMVALRVFDASGNSNQCMVEVDVQDNIPPTILSCPADITVNCDTDVSDLSSFGSVVAEDICGVTVTEVPETSNSSCGNATIVRRFTATDGSGNTTTCQQTITLTNLDPFNINALNPNDSRDDVIWPRDYTTNSGCITGGLEPQDLPAANGFPRTFENSCSQVSVTKDDIVFQYVDGACFKILRTWTIIDFCQYNPFAPDAGGKWDYTQIIEVTNTSKPDILTGCDESDVVITPSGSCSASFAISATATDDCTPAEDLDWSYTVDIGDNGSIDRTGTGSSYSEILDYSTIRIAWSVEDACGNVTTCSNVYTIDDTKKPTPYCLSEIVTVIMETDGTVAIWASDFDNGSFDNCSDVRLSFSDNTNETSITFSCSDIANGIEEMIPVEIWVTDASGNSDFCTATLTLQDNSDVCADNVTGGGGNDSIPPVSSRYAIAGSVATEDAQMLGDVEVMIMANLAEYPAYEMTGNDGRYAFVDLLRATNYVLEPSKIDEADRGVSTLDLVMIQRHILGLSRLDSPYKVIAADVNNSESVTGADVVTLRKLILGITDEFEYNDSWRFVDASFVFVDPINPFPFREQLGYLDLQADMSTADFVAVKIGDVNGSADIGNFDGDASTDSRSAITLQGVLSASGDQILITASQIQSLTGMQLTIDYPTDQMIVKGISSDKIDLTDDNIGWSTDGDGMLAMSWHTTDDVDLSDGEVLFTIDVDFVSAPLASGLSISDRLLTAEAYTITDGVLETVDIAFSRSQDAINQESFRLYQNVPNPFDATTRISFDLPLAGEATLSVYDINGRLIHEIKGDYDKGFHTITLNVNDLDATGILYYQLDSNTNTASKKMVVIR